jgi:hypothetical protein
VDLEYKNYIFQSSLIESEDEERAQFLIARKMFVNQIIGDTTLIKKLEGINKS